MQKILSRLPIYIISYFYRVYGVFFLTYHILKYIRNSKMSAINLIYLFFKVNNNYLSFISKDSLSEFIYNRYTEVDEAELDDILNIDFLIIEADYRFNTYHRLNLNTRVNKFFRFFCSFFRKYKKFWKRANQKNKYFNDYIKHMKANYSWYWNWRN